MAGIKDKVRCLKSYIARSDKGRQRLNQQYESHETEVKRLRKENIL